MNKLEKLENVRDIFTVPKSEHEGGILLIVIDNGDNEHANMLTRNQRLLAIATRKKRKKKKANLSYYNQLIKR